MHTLHTQQTSIGTSFLTEHPVSCTTRKVLTVFDVLESSDTHRLELFYQRVRIRYLTPEGLTFFDAHAGYVHPTSVEREGHRDGVSTNMDWKLAIGQLC